VELPALQRALERPRTVRSYVELLAVNYFALVVYFWKQDSGSGDAAKDKKVYFGDPLLATITAARVGLARDRAAEVENALALALYRDELEFGASANIVPAALLLWALSGADPSPR